MHKPAHKHDCNKCTFLGTILVKHVDETTEKGVEVDMYHCDGSIPTVIARYSSDGSDYSSGILIAEEALKRGDYAYPLVVAYCAAKARGLNTEGG